MNDGTTSTNRPGLLQCVSTPLNVLICPTRRKVTTYPNFSTFRNFTGVQPTAVCRSDYAASCGDSPDYLGPYWYAGPNSLAIGDAMTVAAWASWPPSPNCTGIFYIRSKVKTADITDGTSNTYLAGEKYADPDYYATGTCPADDQSAYCGPDWDTYRWTNNVADCLPMQDCPGCATNLYAFGMHTPSPSTWFSAMVRSIRSTTRSIR